MEIKEGGKKLVTRPPVAFDSCVPPRAAHSIEQRWKIGIQLYIGTPYNIRDVYVFFGEIGGKIKFDGGKRLYKGERIYLYSELFLIFKLFGWKITENCYEYIYIWKIDCSNWNYICLVIWKIKIVGWNIIRLLKLLSLTKSKSNETLNNERIYFLKVLEKRKFDLILYSLVLNIYLLNDE